MLRPAARPRGVVVGRAWVVPMHSGGGFRRRCGRGKVVGSGYPEGTERSRSVLPSLSTTAGVVRRSGAEARRLDLLSSMLLGFGRRPFVGFLGSVNPDLDLFCLGLRRPFLVGFMLGWRVAVRRSCVALRWRDGWVPGRFHLWWLHGLRWVSIWMVLLEGDRVGSWSQVCEWLVKPSLRWMVGRRWLMLEVWTGSIPVWPHDGWILAVVHLLLWGPSFFHLGDAWGFQGAESGLSSPVLQRLLFSLLFSLLFLLFVLRFLVVGSASQISNKSILFRVSVVVVVSGNRIDLGCWLVVRIQSYPVFVLGFHYQPVLRRKGDPGIARPIVFYWLVPILVSATYFGPMCASSGSIRLWLLDPLTRLSLLVGVRICVVSLLVFVFRCKP